MNRFFISPDAISGNSVAVPEEVSAQIRKVLRLKEGTIVHFLDNNGFLYEAAIVYEDEKRLSAEILEKRPAEGEPEIELSLYIGLTQREKFEWILQKCTEAGVSRIVPMVTERSLIRKTADVSSKTGRWEKILKEAAEQCGRARIPVLEPAVPFEQAAAEADRADKAIFCWEEEKQKTLREIIEPERSHLKKTAVMVGPEGGFSPEEADTAKQFGWIPATLGKRIYRMETAAVAAAILILYEFER